MSRLIQLLTEEIPAGAVLDGADFTKYTEAGNLFRLMMITNPDQPIPQTSNRSLVSKMLPNQDAAIVKSLQTYFNNVNKVLQSGKNPSIADKKNYFTTLFDLLLPMTKDNSLIRKSKTIAAAFAGGGESSLNAKRQSVVMIAKSLLGNAELNLNSQDKAIIKGFMIGFEAVVDQDKTKVEQQPETPAVEKPTNTTEQEETTDVVQQKLSTQTTQEVQQAIKDTDTIIEAVKAKQPQTSEEIKKMLGSNKTSDIFRVDLKGDNAVINDKVNEFIDTFYDNLVKQYGPEDANFATKFVSDVLKNLDSAQVKKTTRSGNVLILNVLRLYWDKMEIKATKSANGDMNILLSNGIEADHPESYDALRVEHTIKSSSREKVAKVDFLIIPVSAQGSGISKKMFKDTLELYKAKGVSKMQLHANIDVGGYAWFRYGFVPKDENQIEGIIRWIDQLSPSYYEALRGFSKELVDHIIKQTKSMTVEIRNLIDLLSQGRTPQAKTVLDILFGNCSIEFQMNYSDPKKLRNLGEDIAVKNFKPVLIEKVRYSISYKALFSTNGLKDKYSMAIVPMLYRGMPNALEWEGELDMKNLDKTYAYLSMQK